MSDAAGGAVDTNRDARDAGANCGAGQGRGSRYSGRMRALRIVAVVALLTWSAAADQKFPGMQTKPDQVAAVENPAYVAAGQACENWAWAATMEAMLAEQDVKLDQRFWLFKIYGGTKCLEIGDLEALADQVTGDYRLEDGRQVHIEFQYRSGPPALMDDILASLKEGHALALLWKGHPYLLTGMLYDERISGTGTRYFSAKELRLLDPYVAAGEGHEAVFKTGEDDPADIGGTYQMTAKEILGSDWLRQRTK